MIEPINPNEVYKIKFSLFPDYVVKAINELIVQCWDGKKARIKQAEIVTKIISLSLGNITEKEIIEKKFLDVEELFQEYGWNVKYYKPGYNETEPAYFVFEKRR